MDVRRGHIWRACIATAAFVGPPIVFLAVYLPAIGRGFISDDFGWVASSQVHSVADVHRVFAHTSGFYRPLVSLSFAINYWMFGVHPFGYGATNLILCVACSVLIALLCSRLGFAGGACWFAAAVWSLNFHGINMALLWISGRTALLLVFFAVAATVSVLDRHIIIGALFVLLAMFSKEEAVMLPPVVFFAAYILYRSNPRRRDALRLTALLSLLLVDVAVYLWLRQRAGAITPVTAPSYYKFVFDPLTVARNVLEYIDRAWTFGVSALLAAWALLRVRIQPPRKVILLLAVAWYAATSCITTFLPSRSSLYALLPSVAAVLVVTDVASGLWQRSDHQRRLIATAGLLCLIALLMPVYMTRNQRWTALAKYSENVLDELSADLHAMHADSWLILVDRDRPNRVNIQSSFGTLIGDAVSLRAGRQINVWVDPPLSTAALAGMQPPCANCQTVVRVVQRGHVLRTSSAVEGGTVSSSALIHKQLP